MERDMIQSQADAQAYPQGNIFGINGPVIEVTGSRSFTMQEMVMVGAEELIGEVIGINDDKTIVQVYENTTGIKPGEKVSGTGKQMSVKLGPGIIGNIFDGIERPLKDIEKLSGAWIDRGVRVEPIDPGRKWNVRILAGKGDKIRAGAVIAETKETSLVKHKIIISPGMIPADEEGEIVFIANDGEYGIDDVIAKIKLENGEKRSITLCHEWPIRIPRPCKRRKAINMPLITGQRILDTLTPVGKGGTAAIPGGFGTGKTMTQHQLAKWCDADIIVYIGCGERGNEMTQVLEDFSKLIDPKSGRPLMDRTVLIANTSNMPVAAREASIYTGITLAEYYRDMGYHVAIMADSTSRWAEALREISGRLEEMPAEEGFPAYLSSRLSAFYERAGYVENLNDTEGSVTIIGAVSPQGNDFSEPVTQNTKRFVRCFWALDKTLAYERHYPAIQWLSSYSEYIDDLTEWYEKNIDPSFMKHRTRMMGLLQEESELMDIVRLIGSDVLPDEQKLILEIAKVIRLGFLQQNAYHKSDTYVPLEKQLRMMNLILYMYDTMKSVIVLGIPINQIKETGIFEEVISVKYTIGNDDYTGFDLLKDKTDKICKSIKERNGY